MPDLREVERDDLRALSGLGEEGERVLSLYVGLDQPQAPTGRSRGEELVSRLTAAEEKLRVEASNGDTAALDACLSRVHSALDGAAITDPAVHGVGVICPEHGELRAYALRRPPGFDLAASFRPGAALEPLVEALPGPAWAAIVVDRQHGRVFRGTELGLIEVAEVEDEVHRWHAQGGWSQARYQRGIEKETRDHVRRVCELTERLHERRPIDHLAVVAPAELWPVVEDSLHPYLRERLAGHVAVDVGDAEPDEVLDRCAELIAEQRELRAGALLARLDQDLGSGGGAVAGEEGVLRAAGERRIEVLLVAAGSRSERVERAVEGALAQAADVVVVPPERLDAPDGIAALLRY
ncbi:MAG: Vms1/Ankzf1 family peptidyl-tRNA hydrolase [Syntrophothermus sp.]